jgi:hypothetical protein
MVRDQAPLFVATSATALQHNFALVSRNHRASAREYANWANKAGRAFYKNLRTSMPVSGVVSIGRSGRYRYLIRGGAARVLPQRRRHDLETWSPSRERLSVDLQSSQAHIDIQSLPNLCLSLWAILTVRRLAHCTKAVSAIMSSVNLHNPADSTSYCIEVMRMLLGKVFRCILRRKRQCGRRLNAERWVQEISHILGVLPPEGIRSRSQIQFMLLQAGENPIYLCRSCRTC